MSRIPVDIDFAGVIRIIRNDHFARHDAARVVCLPRAGEHIARVRRVHEVGSFAGLAKFIKCPAAVFAVRTRRAGPECPTGTVVIRTVCAAQCPRPRETPVGLPRRCKGFRQTLHGVRPRIDIAGIDRCMARECRYGGHKCVHRRSIRYRGLGVIIR